ncbi:hypothetical protein Dpoa569_0002817 [Dickeya poaceiphila]|uniref:Uncharacterized protein n=1 Tax=Dickeya poaceiphila TaxID=568768 RepID=A0A5B8HNX1_9GAMM|nr:hypothetical protein Dpoa569_0002817 [Dickeya poaceiphila]
MVSAQPDTAKSSFRHGIVIPGSGRCGRMQQKLVSMGGLWYKARRCSGWYSGNWVLAGSN